MNASDAFSDQIVKRLRRAGLNGVAALFLEAFGPLALLGSQAAYLIEPLFGSWGDQVGELARLLEDPSALPALVEQLKRGEGDQ